MEEFEACFADLPDPRARNAVHDLREMLFIALLATLSGASSCSEFALFARLKAYLLKPVLKLEHGFPSHDTFSRVFRELDPVAFEREFRRFMVAFAAANRLDLKGIIAIDGKALAGAYERGRSTTPLHLVNVFAAEARIALASRKAPGQIGRAHV